MWRLAALLAATLVAGACGSSDGPARVVDSVQVVSTTSTTASSTTTNPPASSSSTTTDPPTTTAPPASNGRGEALKWRPCGDGLECATLTVPMVHGDPSKGDIRIAVNRYQTSARERIGVLLVNPGGPGGSGVDTVVDFAWLIDVVVPGFDVVGFDPRGVGGSTRVVCLEDLDDTVPVLEKGGDTAEVLAFEREMLAACLANSGDLALHVGTNNVARDMDLLREALGEEQITFLGYSYGSRIGAVYAALFPDRVRAMVLDGPVDPEEHISDVSPVQGEGFELAWGNFAAACDANPSCLLAAHGGAEAAFFGVDDLLREGDLPAGDRILTRGEFLLGVAMALYSPYTWVELEGAFVEVLDSGDGTAFQGLADLMMGRNEDGTYDGSQDVNWLVNCADDPERPDPETQFAAADAVADTLPHFGDVFRAFHGCGGLPPAVDPLHVAPADLGVPAVVIAMEGDPATPMAWARALADSIGDAVLITSDGEGHTAFLSNSFCVTDVVAAYLLDLVVPEDGWSCSEGEQQLG